MLIEAPPQHAHRIARLEAGDVGVVARAAQIDDAPTALEKRRASAAEGQSAGVIHIDVRRKALRPAVALRPQAEVDLFPVALTEHRIELADGTQTVAADVKAESDAHRDLDAPTRMCGAGHGV